MGGKSEDTIILCDSPGFGDTGGAVMDIANGLGIAEALRCCKSMKPIIVISKDSLGTRL
jgi:hypothetical protein